MELGKRTIKIILILAFTFVLFELEVLPLMADDLKEPVIQYNPDDPLECITWKKRMDTLLSDYYRKTSSSVNLVACDFLSGPPQEDQVCDVPLINLHPCSPSNHYNYREGSPCVFLKLNPILNWKPQPYNTTRELPDNMPQELKEYINTVSGKPEANSVWVSCEGVSSADAKNIGPGAYTPRRGFPSYYYPFTNQEGYLSPLVAMYFEKPRRGVRINIVCKAWAKNIASETHGSVHFGLLVEGN